MHFNQGLFQNVSDCSLDIFSVLLHLVHFVFHVNQLLLNCFTFFVQLNVVFLRIVVGI